MKKKKKKKKMVSAVFQLEDNEQKPVSHGHAHGYLLASRTLTRAPLVRLLAVTAARKHINMQGNGGLGGGAGDESPLRSAAAR